MAVGAVYAWHYCVLICIICITCGLGLSMLMSIHPCMGLVWYAGTVEYSHVQLHISATLA